MNNDNTNQDKTIPQPDPNWMPPYNVLRANKYPSIQDQLDTLYHEGYDGWKQRITDIKNQYPKPSQDND
jgi:hypothetical protein